MISGLFHDVYIYVLNNLEYDTFCFQVILVNLTDKSLGHITLPCHCLEFVIPSIKCDKLLCIYCNIDNITLDNTEHFCSTFNTSVVKFSLL